MIRKTLSMLIALSLVLGLAFGAAAETARDGHGNEVVLEENLKATTAATLIGGDKAACKAETNLGDLVTDALRWFAATGKLAEAFEEDVVTAGITAVEADADHLVSIWNGGNLLADIPEGEFGAEEMLAAMKWPNTVAVVYVTGAQLQELLEAASQGLPWSGETASACNSFMQVSGLKYTVDTSVAYDKGEAYGENWFRANSLGRVTIDEVNGKPFDPEATYAVITSNANFNGMDASYILAEAKEANDHSNISTAVARDAVWTFINEELKGVIGTDYDDIQGRITIK